MLFIGWGFLMIVCISIYFVAESFERTMLKSAVSQATRDAYKKAAGVAQERGDFELYDTVGKSNQRLERARIAHEIETDIRRMIDKNA